MTRRRRAWMSWSSGKDSTMALELIRHDAEVEITALLVTFNAPADRVAMHAVRRGLVEAQADRLGLPLIAVEIPSPCSNETYEAHMSEALRRALAEGVEHVAFGDLFLADVRAYREKRLADSGISPLFPLWGRPTDALSREILACGVRAVVTCVDPAQVPASFAGRMYDTSFLAELPGAVDPCGEKGEFHTFVFDGPGYSSPIDVEIGEVLERDGFVFCDVRPAGTDD